jgi:hypothetical protein
LRRVLGLDRQRRSYPARHCHGQRPTRPDFVLRAGQTGRPIHGAPCAPLLWHGERTCARHKERSGRSDFGFEGPGPRLDPCRAILLHIFPDAAFRSASPGELRPVLLPQAPASGASPYFPAPSPPQPATTAQAAFLRQGSRAGKSAFCGCLVILAHKHGAHLLPGNPDTIVPIQFMHPVTCCLEVRARSRFGANKRHAMALSVQQGFDRVPDIFI